MSANQLPFKGWVHYSYRHCICAYSAKSKGDSKYFLRRFPSIIPWALIGQAGASPPSRSAGADFYIFLYMSSGNEAFLVPVGPHATGKRIAGSITSSYLDGERAEPRYVLRYLSYVLQASLGYCIDLDYPHSLARQRWECNYRWLCHYTRQGLHVAWGPLAR